jgi:glycosyltransferase involved in cell wall biosynthesis
VAKRICIVTSGPVGSDPRAVKSATALNSAGYEVVVVAVDLLAELGDRNQSIVRNAQWKYLSARRGSAFSWKWRALIEHACRLLWRHGWRSPRMAEWAGGRMISALTRLAISTQADLFIGHNLAGLSAAGRAAKYCSALLAFDAEDDHPGEIEDIPGDTLEVQRRSAILRRWMHRCVFRTAAAPMMARRLEERFNVPFVTVLNVFPRADAEGLALKTKSDAPAIYWFSQTIGPGRGLEALISILAKCQTPFRLDLRGSLARGFERALGNHAAAASFPSERLHVLAPANPDQMSQLSVGYTLGASIEVANSENKRSCLGNKIFQYLLAGVPVLLSDTPAQRMLAAELGEAALLIDLTDIAASAARLDAWHANKAMRERAAQRARSLADTRYNWDIEQRRLLELVSTAFAVERT